MRETRFSAVLRLFMPVAGIIDLAVMPLRFLFPRGNEAAMEAIEGEGPPEYAGCHEDHFFPFVRLFQQDQQ